MKQRRFHWPISVLLLLASAIILWKWPRSARMAAIPSETRPEPAATLPVETVETVLMPAPTALPRKVAARVVQAPVEVPQEPEEMESLAAVMENTNPMKNADIQRAVRTLRTYPPEQVTAYFMQALKDIGSQRPVERDRLIMVANSLQSKTDLPLWIDLVKRQTPRYSDEEKLRNPPHPTLESRFVDMEQLQAIRNIGILAREDRAARRVLMEIILNPDPTAHRTLHREEAYVALKEADLAASLRVLKQLAAEDELLKRL
jgi:hypothetical protein